MNNNNNNNNALGFVAAPGGIFTPALRPNRPIQYSQGGIDVSNNVAALAENAGANNPLGAFEQAAEIAGAYLGLPRGFGAQAARTVSKVVTGYRKGRASLTQVNARPKSGSRERGSAPPPDNFNNNSGNMNNNNNNNNNRRRRRSGNSPDVTGSSIGGSPMVSGDKSNYKLPVLQGPLTTIEGREVPQWNATVDYSNQLATVLYSFATWHHIPANDGYHINLYNSSSIKSTQFQLIFSSLLNDLYAQTTTKFTDLFTYDNFTKYINDFIRAVELIAHVESVLSYQSRLGYSDRITANERLQKMYSSYSVVDAMTRLKTVLKNKYFPPQLTGLIHSTMQLYKIQNLEQSTNFRFTPRSRLLPTFENVNEIDLQLNIIGECELLITELSSTTATLNSKALGFIKPNFLFTEMPKPVPYAVYDPNVFELFTNMTRLYLPKSTSLSVTAFPTQGSTLDDRVYTLNQEVNMSNAAIFALQSQPADENLATAEVTGFNADRTNFGSTFCKIYKLNGDLENHKYNIDNYFNFVKSGSGDYYYQCEAMPDSYSAGRTFVLEFSEGGERTVDPTKFSIVPPLCQRVYFSNGFAPTDAVRKLVDSVFEKN